MSNLLKQIWNDSNEYSYSYEKASIFIAIQLKIHITAYYKKESKINHLHKWKGGGAVKKYYKYLQRFRTETWKCYG